MKLVSWNFRGLGSNSKIDAMKDLISISSPDILLIQETKLEDVEFLQASNTFWKNSEDLAVSARGASGGVGMLWKT